VGFYSGTDGGICMAVGDYKNLALNLSETYRWVWEARFRLDVYRTNGGAK